MIQRSNKRQGEQEEHQHNSNQLNKNEGNMNWHIFPTEAGVRSACRAKADRTTTQNKQAKHQLSKWIWCTTSTRWTADNIRPDSSGHWNRHVHGSPSWGQNTAHAVLVNMPKMWQNTHNPQQHGFAIRPRRFHHRTSQDGGDSDGLQHTVTTFKYVEGGPDHEAPEVVWNTSSYI